MSLHNFSRKDEKILATWYPDWLERIFGYKKKDMVFTAKGTYRPCMGVNVYYDQWGKEWDDRRITIFDDTDIRFPHPSNFIKTK